MITFWVIPMVRRRSKTKEKYVMLLILHCQDWSFISRPTFSWNLVSVVWYCTLQLLMHHFIKWYTQWTSGWWLLQLFSTIRCFFDNVCSSSISTYHSERNRIICASVHPRRSFNKHERETIPLTQSHIVFPSLNDSANANDDADQRHAACAIETEEAY